MILLWGCREVRSLRLGDSGSVISVNRCIVAYTAPFPVVALLASSKKRTHEMKNSALKIHCVYIRQTLWFSLKKSHSRHLIDSGVSVEVRKKFISNLKAESFDIFFTFSFKMNVTEFI